MAWGRRGLLAPGPVTAAPNSAKNTVWSLLRVSDQTAVFRRCPESQCTRRGHAEEPSLQCPPLSICQSGCRFNTHVREKLASLKVRSAASLQFCLAAPPVGGLHCLQTTLARSPCKEWSNSVALALRLLHVAPSASPDKPERRKDRQPGPPCKLRVGHNGGRQATPLQGQHIPAHVSMLDEAKQGRSLECNLF